MERNRLVQELHNKRIIIDGKHVFLENSPFCPNLQPEVGVSQVADNPNKIHTTKEQAQASAQLKTDLLGKIEIGENVPEGIKNKLNAIHIKYGSVFDGDLKDGYNGFSGNFDVNFNFKGGIPPTPGVDLCSKGPMFRGSYVPSFFEKETILD